MDKKFIARSPVQTYVPALKSGILFKGENVIDNAADAKALLRHPGLARFDPSDIVACGLVTAEEVASFGYDVVLPALEGAEPEVIKAKEPKQEAADSAGKMPVFPAMSKQEKLEWAEKNGLAVHHRTGPDKLNDACTNHWLKLNKKD